MTEIRNNKFQAIIAEIINENTIVINKGSNDGVQKGQKFLVYAESKNEIKDPVTKENLGKLEIVKGKGEVIHVQDRLSTIKSVEKYPSTREIQKESSSLFFNPYNQQPKVTEFFRSEKTKPFENPKIGDKTKRIS